jgi:hypothetical protein
METNFLNIIEKGSFKEFINFCINNYINNYINNNSNESIIEIAIKNNNLNLVQSLICNGFILNDNEKEIVNNIVIKNMNNIKVDNNEDVLGWIYH